MAMKYKFNLTRQFIGAIVGLIAVALINLRIEGTINWGMAVAAAIGVFIATGWTS